MFYVGGTLRRVGGTTVFEDAKQTTLWRNELDISDIIRTASVLFVP